MPLMVMMERVSGGDAGKVSRESIIANHWLDVETHYQAAGWKVAYDKPAYNENYPACFTFRPREV